MKYPASAEPRTVHHLRRGVRFPDRLRIARCQKAPEYGPRILFFSGGTALNPLSRVLVDYTHNSIHFTTPFDSGGSSGKLRSAFHIPGIGDLRSRIMALADRSVRGNTEVCQLFSLRLPKDESQAQLQSRVTTFAAGRDELMASIPSPMRQLIQRYLDILVEAMPPHLDLRGASIGNLVMAGGYINNLENIDSVVFLFSQLVEARGFVTPTVNDDLHLAAELKDGTRVIGQHLLCGKESEPIASPIASLRIVDSIRNGHTVRPTLSRRRIDLISEADLICYPMGSFYTSLLANLLPSGVARAIAQNPCPKVYIPNTGIDPEQLGMSPADQVERLISTLEADFDNGDCREPLLDFVVMDASRDAYQGDVSRRRLDELGAQLITSDLIDASADGPPRIDPLRLAHLLLSLT